MNPYGNNYPSMHSPYMQYDPYSYHYPCDFNGPNYASNEPNYASYSYNPNDCYDSYNSSYAQASQYYNAYHDHSFQSYPSQDQSTQSSELHDLRLKMNNDNIDLKKMMQDSMDVCNRITALCDNIDKQFAEKNTFDAYDEGETYEENDNQIINLGDEKEESKLHAENSSHQTPIDHVVEPEYISKYNDGVITKRDGDIPNFYFHDMDQSIKVPNSNPFHDLSCYGDFPSLWLNDEFDDEFDDDDDDDGDDIVSIDGVNIFDEETKDTLLDDEHIPHMLKNDDSLITIPNMHDESNLDAVKEEVPIISHTYTKDMEIIPDLRSTERCIEESPIILSIAPPVPKYSIYDERVLLEKVCHEYNDPYMIPTSTKHHDQSLIRSIIKDMSHSFHLPHSLSCLYHYLFMKSSKIFSFSFIISKIKNHKKMTLKVKFLPASVKLIHWEDDFPLFLLFYDLD